MMSYVTPRVAAKYYAVTQTTLQNWANNGTIETKVLDSGHRRYKIGSTSDERKRYLYCRVSNAKQKPDLWRQVRNMRTKYPAHIVITDVGSGLNLERQGFKRILEQLLSGDIAEVVVAHKDRWCRFNYEHFEWLFSQYDSKLIAVDNETAKSKQEELTEDLMAIVGVFNAKCNGSGKYADNTQDTDRTKCSNESQD